MDTKEVGHLFGAQNLAQKVILWISIQGGEELGQIC